MACEAAFIGSRRGTERQRAQREKLVVGSVPAKCVWRRRYGDGRCKGVFLLSQRRRGAESFFSSLHSQHLCVSPQKMTRESASHLRVSASPREKKGLFSAPSVFSASLREPKQ